jgi:hypothetical protein
VGPVSLAGLIELARGRPVVATVVAALLMVFGILVIVYPGLLAWIAGIGLLLAGVALLASVFVPKDPDGP